MAIKTNHDISVMLLLCCVWLFCIAWHKLSITIRMASSIYFDNMVIISTGICYCLHLRASQQWLLSVRAIEWIVTVQVCLIIPFADYEGGISTGQMPVYFTEYAANTEHTIHTQKWKNTHTKSLQNLKPNIIYKGEPLCLLNCCCGMIYTINMLSNNSPTFQNLCWTAQPKLQNRIITAK